MIKDLLIENHPHRLSVREIGRFLNLSRSMVSTSLNCLEAAGEVEYEIHNYQTPAQRRASRDRKANKRLVSKVPMYRAIVRKDTLEKALEREKGYKHASDECYALLSATRVAMGDFAPPMMQDMPRVAAHLAEWYCRDAEKPEPMEETLAKMIVAHEHTVSALSRIMDRLTLLEEKPAAQVIIKGNVDVG